MTKGWNRWLVVCCAASPSGPGMEGLHDYSCNTTEPQYYLGYVILQFHHKSFPSFDLQKVSHTKVLILIIAVLHAVNILFILPS